MKLLAVMGVICGGSVIGAWGSEVAPRAEAVEGGRVALDLPHCYELALLRMETVGLSEEEVRVAQARYWQAVAEILPEVKVIGEQAFYSDRGAAFESMSGGFGGGGAGMGGGGGVGGFDIDNQPRTGRLSVKVPIFSGFRDIELMRAARAEVAGSRQTVLRVRQNLYRDTADAFYQVLGGEAEVAILCDLVGTYQGRVEDLERRVKLGKSRDSELIQAQSQLARARVDVEQARGLLGASRELLAFLTGMPSGAWDLRESGPELPTAGQLGEYLAQTAGRPDILAALEAERAARKRLSAAKGERLPEINFEWNYYFHDSDSVQDGEWNGMLTVELPLFEGGSIEARVNENKALFAQRRLDLSQLEREAEREVRVAFNNFNARLAEYARLMEAQATAELNYRAQLADYNLGVVNNLDVLVALQSFHTVRREVAAARYRAFRDLVDLTVAAGAGRP